MPYPPAGASVTALSKTSLDLLINNIRKKRQALKHTDSPIRNNKKPKQEMREHNIFTKMQAKGINQNVWKFLANLSDVVMARPQAEVSVPIFNVIPSCFLTDKQNHSIISSLFSKPLPLHSHP